jgi:hypothetical protein
MIRATLPSSNIDTLLKLLGMCGSSFPGERATAALKADQLIRTNGLTWADVIAPPLLPATENDASDWRAMRDFCWQRSHLLRQREQEFVSDLIRWRGRLTERQGDKELIPCRVSVSRMDNAPKRPPSNSARLPMLALIVFGADYRLNVIERQVQRSKRSLINCVLASMRSARNRRSGACSNSMKYKSTMWRSA